ncbi:MAG: amidohydrolase family protein [Bacteroidales bacterium]
MKNLFIIITVLLFAFPAQAQYITKYPEIPRIDVHAHPGNNYNAIGAYLAIQDELLSDYKIDLAMWINVGSRVGGESAIDTIAEASKGRVLTCISDYTPHTGLTHKSKDIAGYLKKGYVGYKIWYGTLFQQFTKGNLKEGDAAIKYIYLDDPHHKKVFAAMEKSEMVMASVHIADPNGPFGNRRPSMECFCPDPVEFWRSIMGLERVLQRYPNLVIVAAHGAWLMVQDAHLDFLRYLFKTYPNFYVDIAATEGYYLCDRENLRDLFIEYSNRILFGTDIGSATEVTSNISRYTRLFQFYETDVVRYNSVSGLDLPKEALENIYYKNAMKIYPHVKESLKGLGYKIE